MMLSRSRRARRIAVTVLAVALTTSFALASSSMAEARTRSDVTAPRSVAVASANPGTFVSLDPTRVLDTRVGNGAPQTPVAASSTVGLQIAGRGGVPLAGVAAVVVNVTVTGSRAAGFITVYPSGGSQPTASNLNFTAGQSIPNLVTVKVGADGKINLANNSAGTAHLIADVAGYYLAGTATVPGAFVSVDPARVLDTRAGNGAPQASIRASATLALQVLGRGGVPATGVAAVVMNVTATSPTAGGFLTVYPSGKNEPTASNLNFSAGQSVPNLTTVKVGNSGFINIANNSAGTIHLIADVAGYYLAGTATAPGAFVSVDPARVLDTRDGYGAPQSSVSASGTVELQVTNRGGVPSPGVAAVIVNVTATSPSTGGFVTVYPTGSTQPTASNLNFTAGQSVPNLAAVKVGGNGRIDLANNSAGTVDLIADVAGYFIADPQQPAIVWPSGWYFDDCGTESDELLLHATPGIVYTPQGPWVYWEGEGYYDYFPDASGEIVLNASAAPGYVIAFPEATEWITNPDGSVTGTIYFSSEGC